MALEQGDAIKEALNFIGVRAYVENHAGKKIIGQLVPDRELPKKQPMFEDATWTLVIEKMRKHYATIGQKISAEN